MYIDPLRRVNQAGPTRRTTATGGAFSVPDDGPEAARATAPTQATAGLDAILALQGEPQPQSRRARQMQRGRKTLDALDALQRAIVLGSGGAMARSALLSIGEELEPTGDADLDSVLIEIETRRAVELAKLERS